MGPAQIEAMQMMATKPTRETRVTWFLEGCWRTTAAR
jgi:hypothetical protein